MNADPIHQDSSEISSSTREAVIAAVGSTFPPEFINRLDEFNFFRRLSKSALRGISNIRLNELQFRLEDRRVELTLEDDVSDWLVEKAHDPRYGARPLNRLIFKQIATGLADRILRREVGNVQQAKVEIARGGDNLLVLPST